MALVGGGVVGCRVTTGVARSERWRRRAFWRWAPALLVAALVLAALPGVAGAQGSDQPGVVTFSGGDPVVDTAVPASLSDPDTVSGTPTWQWSRSGTRNGSFTTIDGAASASYTPVEADKAFFLQVTATYTDGHGANKTATATTELPVGVPVRSLVKNTQQRGDRALKVTGGTYARFVTGDNPAGYAVTRVGIKAGNWVISAVSYIRESYGAGGAEVGPAVVNLWPAGKPVASRVNWYDADEGATLEANTRYWLSYCCYQQPELITSHGEDGGRAHGWSIDNLYAYEYYIDSPPSTSNSHVPVIDIKGFELLGPPGPPLGLSAAAATDSLTLSWSAPGSLGHRPVTKYQTRSRHASASAFEDWTDVGDGAQRTATFANLNGGNNILQVRAVNAQGAGAEAELVAATQRPGVLSVRASTPSYAPSGRRTTYGPDDTIVITVAFTGAVTVAGSPTFTFVLGTTDVAATYLGGTGTDELTFSYAVMAADSDSDGISWAANQLALGEDVSITATGASSLDATIIHAAQSARGDRLVDGSATDNQPATFPHDTITLSVNEDAARGSAVGMVPASDPEGGKVVHWTNIIPDKRAESAAFYRDFTVFGNGSIWIRADLDYESGTTYAKYVDASDCRDRYGVSQASYCILDDRTEVVIEVVNVDELGVGAIKGTLRVGSPIGAALQDPDGGVSVDSWQWSRSSSRDGEYTPIAGADQVSYIPTTDDKDKWLRAVATYSDGHGPGKTVTATASRAVRPGTPPGMSVSEMALTVTEEDTIGNTYTVRLDTQPAAQVTVTLAGHAGTDVTPSPTTLTFMPLNWTSAQTVTVTAGDDADTANDSATLTHSATSTDNDYAGISIANVVVTVTDNDTSGVSVSERALTVTEEDPIGNSYTVALDTEPAAQVTVTVAGHAGTDVTPSPTTLTFTPQNWATAQTVTVTAGDDADTANDSATLTHSAASTDSGYAGITIANVVVTVTDNDTSGVSVSERALTVTEGDAIGNSYTVALDTEPAAQVTVTVGGHAGTDVTPSPTTLTFTPQNWATAQTVTVTAGDDADAANDSVTLTHSATSTDSGYAGITIATVVVRVTDNDTSGVTVSERALTVTEGDAIGNSYTVALDTEPAAQVTVTVAGHAGTDVTPSPTTLTFTRQNWATAQTVTVTAGDDADTANDSVTLTHSAASTDSGYAAITIATVVVRVTDNDSSTPPPIGGSGGGGSRGGGGFAGGGGGGGGGPSPSVVDFEWNVTRDIDDLDSAHGSPSGMWSDGTTLWVLENGDGADDAIYAYDLETGERVEDREFDLDDTNRAPRGVWSDRSTVWVSDSGRNSLFAHDLETGERLPERDAALAERNRDPRGIWSDGQLLSVLDSTRNAVFVYGLQTGELVAEYALDSANGDPHGIWSDGVTTWVSDHTAKRLIAYRLADGELVRNSDEEFKDLSKAGNNTPRGIWSDGDVMYVADASDDKVYTYNMPDALDARLATLELSGVAFGEFSPLRYDYASDTIPDGNIATLTATPAQPDASLRIRPADQDGDPANGYQMRLLPGLEITITVTSPNGSRARTYRLLLGQEEATGRAPDCLRGAVTVGFSLVVSARGSVEDLEACARSRNVTALYTLDGGEYVSYILGAPGFVNDRFGELYAGGVPALTPLIASSDGPATAAPVAPGVTGPWPDCLRGEIVEGFNLVLYEGGSVDDLDACAEEVGLAALYVLDDGVWVSYILGAPELVNREFRGLYAGGVPVATPLVGKSD